MEKECLLDAENLDAKKFYFPCISLDDIIHPKGKISRWYFSFLTPLSDVQCIPRRIFAMKCSTLSFSLPLFTSVSFWNSMCVPDCSLKKNKQRKSMNQLPQHTFSWTEWQRREIESFKFPKNMSSGWIVFGHAEATACESEKKLIPFCGTSFLRKQSSFFDSEGLTLKTVYCWCFWMSEKFLHNDQTPLDMHFSVSALRNTRLMPTAHIWTLCQNTSPCCLENEVKRMSEQESANI